LNNKNDTLYYFLSSFRPTTYIAYLHIFFFNGEEFEKRSYPATAWEVPEAQLNSIKPGESAIFKWNQKNYVEMKIGSEKSFFEFIEPGRYNVTFEYQIGDNLTICTYNEMFLCGKMHGWGIPVSPTFEITSEPVSEATRPLLKPSTNEIKETVLIYTDKTHYEAGETVKITVLNNGTGTAYYECFGLRPLGISLKQEGNFTFKNKDGITAGQTCTEKEREMLLESGGMLTFEWNQTIMDDYMVYCANATEQQKEAVRCSYITGHVWGDAVDVVEERRLPGIYRMNFYYHVKGEKDGHHTYSEEFEIK